MDIFERAIDSFFGIAFGVATKIVGATFLGAFTVLRKTLSLFQDGKRIRRTARASKNNRGVRVSSSVDKNAICLNDDPKFDDTETVTDKDAEPALDYLKGDSKLPESVVVSGGTEADRCRTLMPFIYRSQTSNMPLVIIHNSDSTLESMIASSCKVHEIISAKGLYCDIFAGLIPDDIVRLISDTIGEDNGTESLLRALVNVVLTKRPDACIEDIASFPLGKLRDGIIRLNASGVLTKKQYSDWLEDYDAGSGARVSLRTFLTNLADDFRHVFGAKRAGRSSIVRTLNHNGAVMIDIGKGTAELAVKLLINYLLLLDKNHCNFNFIIDDFYIAKFPEISDIIRGRTYAISHSDFAASLSLSRSKYTHENNSDELFRDLTHDAGVVCVFCHQSADSCRRWSEYFGTYRKIKTQREHSSSGGWASYNPAESLSEQEHDLPRVRGRSIESLPSGVACVYRKEGIFIGSI
ncbi:MAG: hypothetical protein IJT02_09675 [Synergistaceae bacterium]|nr:hypothetical protein [Synergistaceae bacterium]